MSRKYQKRVCGICGTHLRSVEPSSKPCLACQVEITEHWRYFNKWGKYLIAAGMPLREAVRLAVDMDRDISNAIIDEVREIRTPIRKTPEQKAEDPRGWA